MERRFPVRTIPASAAVVVMAFLSACSGAEETDRGVASPPTIGGGGVGAGSAGGGDSDTIAPRVIATDPPADSVGVAVDDVVRATFSEAMDPATLNIRSFTVTDGDGIAARGDVSYAGQIATFTPSAGLPPATTFTVVLTTDVADLAGNALPASLTWSFTTVLDIWQATPVTAATPIERTGHTAVWTGSEMIVWGGATTVGPTDSGGRLVPGMPWSATTTAGAPLPRLDHTAVWTGDQMIVWGGEISATSTRTGARYTPAADEESWFPTAIMDAPLARRGHTAVWTGREMIVWGGLDGAQPLRSGGRYDPVSDEWMPVSMLDTPSARFGHTAVWTGSEMIVWGGRDALQQPLRSGARYNPVTDTWSALSTADAPSARYDHTAVWTGTEMIVWGGRTAAGLTRTGGRYDPATDSWSFVSTSDAPRARAEHTAVWTGTEMIVWGGQAPEIVRSGARYQPAADRWRDVSQENAPTARFDHTAVWTGTEMIVWGGTPGFLANAAGSGGRYAP